MHLILPNAVSGKKGHHFFLHNFNKCRHSFVILGKNILRTYFTKTIENLFLILLLYYVVMT